MKKLRSLFIMLIVCALVCVVGGRDNADAKTLLSMGTGNPAGTYYFVGAGFCNIWNKHVPGIKMIAESTAAGAENLALTARGKIDTAFCVGATVAKEVKLGRQDLSQVRILCSSLYGSEFHFIVRKDSPIKSFKDFVGKKVSFGPPGSGTLDNGLALVETMGYKKEDFQIQYLSSTEAITAIRDNTADVTLIKAAAPVASIVDLSTTVPIRLIPIKKSEFAKVTHITELWMDSPIPAGTYKGIDHEVISQSDPTFILINKNVDDDIAYNLIKALYENEQERNAIHPAASKYNLETALAGYVGNEQKFVPFHDGAIRYLKEKGKWPY